MKNLIFILLAFSSLVSDASYIYKPSSGGSGSGVDTIGAFSGSAQTNGASISSTTITFGPASGTVPGMVSTGAQTWAGAKTLSTAPILSSLTLSTVPYLDASKQFASSAVTPTELGYVSGVTSAIQTQFSGKVGTSGNETVAGTKTFSTAPILSSLTLSTVPYLDGSKQLTSSLVTPTELGYVHSVTSAIQTQLDAKAPLASPTFTGTVTLPGGTVTTSAWKFGSYHVEPSEADAGNSSTAVTIDLSTGSVQKLTLTGSTTITLSNPVTGGAYVIRIIQGASAYTVTWPGTVKWSGGTAPIITTTNAKIDIVNLLWDGSSYYGTFSQNY